MSKMDVGGDICFNLICHADARLRATTVRLPWEGRPTLGLPSSKFGRRILGECSRHHTCGQPGRNVEYGKSAGPRSHGACCMPRVGSFPHAVKSRAWPRDASARPSGACCRFTFLLRRREIAILTHLATLAEYRRRHGASSIWACKSPRSNSTAC